ncbi:hypothetical protein M0812_30310 [Anaeramoeba flamelloides]|uniref:Uncharacterized protein n=1 Tax=Anaeramoeba flamelloides TaxID=1746091 RepID=A0AAV7Y8C9_9EUKA|nr:hypothetical protein M0812_30310 [Anaeramoeba flamelloides]
MNINEVKQEEVNETKKQIKILKKLKKDKKTIKLIRESKEIIEKSIDKEKEEEGKEEIRRLSQRVKKEEKEEFEEEKEEFEEEKEEFDPKMNLRNIIKLKNENKTAWNPSSRYFGRICGKKIYYRGKHQIKIKIDQCSNSKDDINYIYLGVIKTENIEHFIKSEDYEKTYYFSTVWNKKKSKAEK